MNNYMGIQPSKINSYSNMKNYLGKEPIKMINYMGKEHIVK